MSMTDLDLPPDPILERRQEIQKRAAQTIGRRSLASRIFLGVLLLAFVAALVPLGSVIFALLQKGASSISWPFLTKLPSQPSLIAQNAIGGIGNPMEGILIFSGLPLLFAVPLAMRVGLYLS